MHALKSSPQEILKLIENLPPTEVSLWLSNMESKLLPLFSVVDACSLLSAEDIHRQFLDGWYCACTHIPYLLLEMLA